EEILLNIRRCLKNTELTQMTKLDNLAVLKRLTERFGDSISEVDEPFGLLTVSTDKENIIAVLEFLKKDEELQFIYLTDITAVHYPEKELGIAVVYHLHSLIHNI